MKHLTLRIFLGLFVLLLSSLACSFSASTASISDAEMARDAEGAQATTTFGPSDTFYATLSLNNAPDDTVVKAVWTAVTVEGEEPNVLINETELETGSGEMYFELSNTDQWPSGDYKVDLYLNDELSETLEFSVQ